MVDRTTKALLLTIAVGLWVHLATDLLTPAPVFAQQPAGLFSDRQARDILSELGRISADTASMNADLDTIDDAVRLHLGSIEENTEKTVACIKALGDRITFGCL